MFQELAALLSLDTAILMVIEIATLAFVVYVLFSHLKDCGKHREGVAEAIADARAESAEGDKLIRDELATQGLKLDSVARDTSEVVGYIKAQRDSQVSKK